MNAYVILGLAIVFEVAGTSLLKATASFTSLWASIAVLLCYLMTLWLASVAIDRGVPVGVGYALWSGIGLILVAAVATFAYKQRLDLPAILGICLIVCGIVVMQMFSKTLRFMD